MGLAGRTPVFQKAPFINLEMLGRTVMINSLGRGTPL